MFCYDNGLFNVKKRLNKIAIKKGVIFINDYAHHPTEVINILNTIKFLINNNNYNIFTIFEPHKYARLYKLYEEFIISFTNTVYLLILDVYKTDKKEKINFNVINFIRFFVLYKPLTIFYAPKGKYIKAVIEKYSKPNDYVLFLGAGKISKIVSTIIPCL